MISSRDQQICSAKLLLPSKQIIGLPLNLLYLNGCSEKERLEDEQKPKEPPVNGADGRGQPRRQAAIRACKKIQQQLNDYMTGQE